MSSPYQNLIVNNLAFTIMDTKVDPSMIFSGSGAYKYEPTAHLEAGISTCWFHSIQFMQQYEHKSFEEIRLEDYNASGGLFGSKLATLAAALCAHPGRKLTPYHYGILYQEAIGPSNQKEEVSNTIPSPAAPVDQFIKMESHFRRPTVNLSFNGKQNVTVFIESGSDASDVNFSFKNQLFSRTSENSVPKSTKCDQSKENIPRDAKRPRRVDKGHKNKKHKK